MSGNENIRYAYFRDNNDPNRVLTIARRREGDELVIGYAICRPFNRGGNRFKKDLGRRIASGRLEAHGLRVSLVEDTSGMISVLEGIQAFEAENNNRHIRRMLEYELDRRRERGF